MPMLYITLVVRHSIAVEKSMCKWSGSEQDISQYPHELIFCPATVKLGFIIFRLEIKLIHAIKQGDPSFCLWHSCAHPFSDSSLYYTQFERYIYTLTLLGFSFHPLGIIFFFYLSVIWVLQGLLSLFPSTLPIMTILKKNLSDLSQFSSASICHTQTSILNVETSIILAGLFIQVKCQTDNSWFPFAFPNRKL